MNRYLIDTNILSEPLRPKPDEKVVSLMKQHTSEISIAVITWHEILFGYHRLPASRRKDKIERYLTLIAETFVILPYTIEAAVWHAKERARLTNTGKPPSFPDSQIASIAVVNDLIVVTRNVVDFQNFQSLKTENWFQNS